LSSKYFVFCCLLFALLGCGSYGVAGDPADWGVLWEGMEPDEKSFYLLGYRDGLQMSTVGAKHGFEISSLGHSDVVVAAAVSDLYRDGRNSVIPINLMVIVAKDRLDGVDVREALRRFRRGVD